MRRILATAIALVAAAGFLFITLGTRNANTGATYRVELQNSFGLTKDASFKVAGVIVGKITKIDLCSADKGSHCQNPLDASITVTVNEKGFGTFHHDATCQSRPQSLIGEYYLDCQPGTSGPALKVGSTIPVSQTQSTIPADLVQNIMRLPYRQRFSLIINELGAAVAARSTDLQTALRRADPALAETDNLLALLASDATTIRDLNVSANNVIKAMANNSTNIQRFIVEANNTSQASASPNANSSCSGNTQANCIAATWNKLPGFLEQLRPAMQKLGAAADAQDAVFTNLNDAATNLTTFFHRLVPFSHQSAVSLTCGENGGPPCPGGGASLGSAAKVGTPAVKAAQPTVQDLRQFAGPVSCLTKAQGINRAGKTGGFVENCLPELASNLALTLNALDAHKPINYGNGMVGGGPVEPDPRSPGGTGYSGLEGLMMYAFNISNAINTFSSYGHELAVDVFANSTCSPYASPQSIANNIANYQKSGGDLNSFQPNNPRTCYAFGGPQQPGVTTTDPTNPSACVPDPGGYPVQGYGTHYHGAPTSACKLQSSPFDNGLSGGGGSPLSGTPLGGGSGGVLSGLPPLSKKQSATSSASGALSAVGNAVNQATSGAASAAGSATSGSSSGSNTSSSQTQQLLNYLLAP
jgi:phospholipid/cholesterol/gamma-HCH transport system substrate-binding protein